MKKFGAIAGLLLALAGVAFALESVRDDSSAIEGQGGARVMSIEDYFRLNISALSPVKEQLGGTFYVTKIEVREGEGTVEYEDGHSAYVADFTYSTDERGAISVETFAIRRQ